MTRILLISRCPPYPLHLGDRLIIWHLVRELSKRGYEVDLFAYAQHASDHHEADHYQHYFNHIHLIDEPPRPRSDYIKRVLLPTARFPKIASASWSAEMWNAIETHLAKYPVDIVHVFGGVQVYEFAHLLKDFPTIITPYESYSLYLKRVIEEQGGLMNHVNRFMARQFEKWMFTPYGATVVLTEEDKSELLGINPNLDIAVIPNGIDLDFFHLQDTQRDKSTLLFVGNYDYPPNLDAAMVLIQTIFPKIQAEIPDVKLKIVGNAPPLELQAMASSNIEVTGRVPDVRPYLAEATAFICPLRIGAGIKNKVLEALAMGLPTVATPLSVDGIAVQHNESVIVASIESMADETIRLLKNQPLQSKLSQAGCIIIEENYSWESVAEKYINLYRNLVD